MWLLDNASNSEINHPSPVLTKFNMEQRGCHEFWQKSPELVCRKSMCFPFRGHLVKNSILYRESWMLNLFSVLVQFMSQMHSCSPFSRQLGFRFSQRRFCRVWTTLGSESTVTKLCVHSWHHPAEMESTTSPTEMSTQAFSGPLCSCKHNGLPLMGWV